MGMLSVEDALQIILGKAAEVDSEQVDLKHAIGRVLFEDVVSQRTQPPFDVSAMDGYAVRASDVANPHTKLKIIGYAPAGHAFEGTVNAGETVRIFTGSPMPEGTDSVLIQENAQAANQEIIALESVTKGQFVRERGLDFSIGESLLKKKQKLNYRDVSLAASMNHPTLPVYRKPRVGILSTGDELVPPGTATGPGQIVASNNFGLHAFVEQLGCEPVDLGIAQDDSDDISKRVAEAADVKVDVLVTLGGASVGDHDLVKPALANKGVDLEFWRIAMRPGKPLMFGHRGDLLVLGLPGNPVSTLVCSIIFLKPLLLRMQGLDPNQQIENAILLAELPKNDQRQDYLRAVLQRNAKGKLTVRAFSKQDSSMLALMVEANCLVIRPPHAESLCAGNEVPIIKL